MIKKKKITTKLIEAMRRSKSKPLSFSMKCAFVTKKEKNNAEWKLATFQPEYKRLIRRKNVSLSNTIFDILRLNRNQTENIPQKTNTFHTIEFKTRVKKIWDDNFQKILLHGG